MDGVEWHPDLLEDFGDSCLCLFPSLPSLRRLEGFVRALLPRSDSRDAGWRRRRRETNASFLCLAAGVAGSTQSMRTMVLDLGQLAAAVLAGCGPGGDRPRRHGIDWQWGTYTQQ
jgi:hypothetical protein